MSETELARSASGTVVSTKMDKTAVVEVVRRSRHPQYGKTVQQTKRYHTHDEEQPLDPGKTYELDVEVWPTCIHVPAGYRVALSVRGKDYEYPGDSNIQLGEYANWTGVAIFRHDDPRDRPAEIFGGDVTLHTGPKEQAYVMLPVIPEKKGGRK